MSWPNVNEEKIAETVAKVMTNGDTIFTVLDDIQIISLVAHCDTTGTPAASTLQYQFVPVVGAAATFTGASGSLATAVAGSTLNVADGQTTAPTFVVSGANNQNTYPIGIYCPKGAIKLVVGTGPTTGTWHHHIRYRSLSPGSHVVSA